MPPFFYPYFQGDSIPQAIIPPMPEETRTDLFEPHMPAVDIRPDIETIFARARAEAAVSVEDDQGLHRRQLIIVTPGRLIVSKECPLPLEIPQNEIGRLKELIPPKPAINIAAIAYTYLEAMKEDMAKAVPFIGYLLGFGMLGHAVWVFEGHPSALAAGCRDADMLLVDGGMLPYLEQNPAWRETALGTMRGSEIKLITREGS